MHRESAAFHKANDMRNTLGGEHLGITNSQNQSASYEANEDIVELLWGKIGVPA
jgi:hypothetical protein